MFWNISSSQSLERYFDAWWHRRLLGASAVAVGSGLQWFSSYLCSCFFHPRDIAMLRLNVSPAENKALIHVFISSHLDYWNSLFTCPSKTYVDHLDVVQNTAAKLLTISSKQAHVNPIVITLNWLPIKFRIQFQLLVIAYRALMSPIIIRPLPRLNIYCSSFY